MNHRRQASTIAMAVALTVLWLTASGAGAAEEERSPIRGVLFFSPACGHCEYVINTVLPPLFMENGGPAEVSFDITLEDTGIPFYLLDNGTLQFLLVDVSVEAGAVLFIQASDHYHIDSAGVPRMIIDDEVYIGSVDIPEALSDFIAVGLEGNGIEWPSLSGVDEAVASVAGSTTTGSIQDEAPSTSDGPGQDALPFGEESWADRFGRDPFGNTLAVMVLAGMLASLVAIGRRWRRPQDGRRPGLAVPVVAVFGMAVAGYLAYVETTGVEAVCGPVGDCNAVQQSDYAELFGVLPVGVLGLVGYVVVLGTWLIARTDSDPLSGYARILLFLGTIGGVVLSVYLTFLEPFVIGATCAWCLISAVAVTTLMWLTVGPATDAWSRTPTRATSKG